MKKLAQLVLATGLLTTACAASAQGLAAAQARAFPRHLSSRRDQHRSLSALHKRLDCQRAGPRHVEVADISANAEGTARPQSLRSCGS